ncbi:MAG: hypothetical protein ABIH42_09470, partial [Planctomycetota bacterium]
MKFGYICFIIAFVFIAVAQADVVTLKSGEKVEGQVLEESEEHVVVKTETGEKILKKEDIDKIEK